MKKWILAMALLPTFALADGTTVNMYLATDTDNGQGAFIGTVTFEDSPDFDGVLITPDLNSLPVGIHGFHIHERPDCAPAIKEGQPVPALSAGGHFDPEQTGVHLGPYKSGHLGDLPILVVGNEGRATHPMLAPRIAVEDIGGHALMIHTGGDNYSDIPLPLGGGGARLACGVIASD